MDITRQLAEALETETLHALLDDYGRWCRTGVMPKALHRGQADPPRFITEDTAMAISEAMGSLKRLSSPAYDILHLRFVRQLSNRRMAAELSLDAELVPMLIDKSVDILGVHLQCAP